MKLNTNWEFKESFPTISAYTTVYNCLKNNYPFERAIRSFLWADEVVVVDGGSSDGTRERLEELAQEFPNLKIYDMPLEWENPGKDGAQKAISRAMCMSEFCVQFDADEFCGGDKSKWLRLAKEMPENVHIYELFVAEPFGSETALRLNKGHNPLKWRLSRNRPEITHGIPDFDKVQKDGKTYSSGKSDGCFHVHVVDNQVFPSTVPQKSLLSLYSLREKDIDKYAEQVHSIIKTQPYVFHAGHVDLENKIKLYLSEWHQWWCDLYGKDPNDPANNVYFPNRSIAEITDDDIKRRVLELKEEIPTVEVPNLI